MENAKRGLIYVLNEAGCVTADAGVEEAATVSRFLIPFREDILYATAASTIAAQTQTIPMVRRFHIEIKIYTVIRITVPSSRRLSMKSSD